jgi:hypothetical protein
MKTIQLLTAFFASLALVKATPVALRPEEPLSEAYAKRAPAPTATPASALIVGPSHEGSLPNATTTLTERDVAHLDWDWPSITFNNGVPVGGYAHLSIRSDGTYSFSGHFHDSGATSYNMGVVWVVKDSQNIAYTFEESCRVHGTFEAGSRDCDWNDNGYNANIQNNWGNIAAGWYEQPSAAADLDILAILNSLISAIEEAIGVVSTIIAIV